LLQGTDSAGNNLGDRAGGALRTMLSDGSLGPRLEDALRDLDSGGHLDEIPIQLLYFTQVDAKGNSVSAGSDSALVSMLRLLDAGSNPISCSIIGIPLLSFDNLAVTLLEGIARLGSGTTVSAVGLLGSNLLNYEILAFAAENNPLCSGLTGQMVQDMESIDRFNDPEVGDLLEILHGVLQALYGPGTSRVPELVEALAAVHGVGGANALEEVLRDLGDGALAQDLVGMVSVFLDPEAFLDTSEFPEGVAALDFDMVWASLGELVSLRESGRSAAAALAPVLETVLLHEATWTALGNASPLLQRDDARIHTVIEFMPTLLDWDAEMEVFGTITDPMLDPEVVAPLLRVLEMPEVAEALAATGDDNHPGPLAFGGQLLAQGTLPALLVLLDELIDLIQPS